MQQYFVGADDDQVVIYQGVRGDVLGHPAAPWSTERTDIAADRPAGDRARARSATASYASDGLDDARGLVTRLRARCCAPCPTTPAPAVVAPAPVPRPGRGAARRPPVDPALPPPVDTTPAADGAARAGNDLPAGGLMAATAGDGANRTAPPPLPTGRGAELVLLVFAAVIVTGALVLVEVNQEPDAEPALFYVGAGLPRRCSRSRTSRCAGSRRTPTR